jgi:hypothetical protein
MVSKNESGTSKHASNKDSKKKQTIIISQKKPQKNVSKEEDTEKNVKNILDKRDKFVFEICESMAKTMIDHETKLFKKIPANKIVCLKKNAVKKVIVKMLQDTFNEIYKNMLEKKKFNNEYDNIISYFGHSKLGFIHLIAPKCVQLHMNIERENLDTSSEEEYIQTFSILVNDELNNNYYEILHEFVCELENETYDDKMLKDPDIKKNTTPFNFKIELDD